MVNSQFQKWADDAADIAGKAYDQGKSMFYSSGARAQKLANQAVKSEQMRRMAASLPKLQAQAAEFSTGARDNFSRMCSTVGKTVYNTESMALKASGLYLLMKWFQNREKNTSQMAEGIKDHISEKPIASALIALSLGYAIGKLRR